jgi:hypothetical protein
MVLSPTNRISCGLRYHPESANFQFLYQKLDYIHHNPVGGKGNLSTEFTDYAQAARPFMS